MSPTWVVMGGASVLASRLVSSLAPANCTIAQGLSTLAREWSSTKVALHAD
jgi:hypothetical protein